VGAEVTQDINAESVASARETDGRRRRGLDSRTRIVAAMLDIIREGEMSPSAEQVATRADVGLRTVFRHFADMDSLYSEMTGVIEAQLMALAGRPFLGADWKARVVEMVERRAEAFEKIAPFKHASEAIRHRSRFIQADSDRLVVILRQILELQLPQALIDDPLKVEALDLLLSFEAWSRLHREQGLSSEQIIAVLRGAVRRVLDQDD